MSDNERVATAIEKRRQHVFVKRFLMGETDGEIAETLGIERAVVEDDIQALRASVANAFKDSDPLEVMAVDAAVLGHVRTFAMREFADASDGMTKSEFLKTAIMASECRGRLLTIVYDIIGTMHNGTCCAHDDEDEEEDIGDQASHHYSTKDRD